MSALPYKSLDAVTTTGPGKIRDFESLYRRHTIHVIVTGAPERFHVAVQGSMDGQNWFGLVGVQESEVEFETSEGHNVRYVRAFVTLLQGGTSPTVTAWIASTPT